MKTTNLFVFAAIVTATIALAGCVQTPAVDEPRAATTSAPELVVEDLVGDINGDGNVSPYEKSLLAPESYTLPDGTEVPLVEGEPIPEVVISAVQTSVLSQAGSQSSSGSAVDNSNRTWRALQASEAEGKKLGTIIIPVIESYDGMRERFVWAVAGSALGTGNFDDRASAVAAADAWVGDKNVNRPGSYLVVVFPR
jgi:hypothetical protein